MRAAVAKHHKLTETLAPLFDDAGFNLLMGLQIAGKSTDPAKASALLTTLADGAAPEVLALAELRAEANFEIGLLSEVALSPSTDLLPPLLDRFTAGSYRALKEAASLDDNSQTRDLRTALAEMLALGKGNDGIFAVRHRELDAISDGWRLVAVNQKYAKVLSTQVETAVAAARETSKKAVDTATATVAKSVAVLIALVVGNLVVAIMIGFFFVDRRIIRRLVRLNQTMLTLAQGKLDVVIPHEGRDEISRMASAVEVFKANALQRRALEAEKAKEGAWKEERRLAIESYIAAFDRSGNELAKALAAASIEMDATARAMSHSAQGTAKEATAVNSAAERAASCADSAARAAEEMSICIGDISQRMSQSSKISRRAVDEAKRADAIMQRLAGAAARIGQVVDLIREVASQTNLLALNATIEAARVGKPAAALPSSLARSRISRR